VLSLPAPPRPARACPRWCTTNARRRVPLGTATERATCLARLAREAALVSIRSFACSAVPVVRACGACSKHPRVMESEYTVPHASTQIALCTQSTPHE
jgi:hypothetical protein